MNGIEKRRHTRVTSKNLLNFICLGEEGDPCQQGMGRTLNVSESGILLETYYPIDPQTRLSIAIGIEEELINIEGTVVFLKQSGQDTFEAGINFSQISDQERKVLIKFIEAFQK